MNQPKVLVFDVETSPIVAEVWDIWDVNVSLNQILHDWSIIAWSAKWLGAPVSEVMYCDTRHQRNLRDDKHILKALWKLLDEADIVITQNGKKFDSKKVNTRFLLNGMQPPSPYRHIDTLVIAKKAAAFTSNKLEYLTDRLCTKYKKLKHTEFPGQVLWTECMKGNQKAWAAMEKYNIHDVLSTEELYTKLQAWDSSIDFGPYGVESCNCGSEIFEARGFAYTSTGKFQRYRCKGCGKWSASRINLITKGARTMLPKSAGGH